MRKAIAIFFLILLVSVHTPAGQIFKLPKLVEHLAKHQKQNGVSLIGFLKDHYMPGHNDADFPEDEQLPFKSITFSAISYAIVPGPIKLNEFVCLPLEKKLVVPDAYTLQQHLVNIFHPPRV